MSKVSLNPRIDPNNPAKKASLFRQLRRAAAEVPDLLDPAALALGGLSTLFGVAAISDPILAFVAVPLVAISGGFFAVALGSDNEAPTLIEYLASSTGVKMDLVKLEKDLPLAGLPTAAQLEIRTQLIGILQASAKQIQTAKGLPKKDATLYKDNAIKSLLQAQQLCSEVSRLCHQKETLEASNLHNSPENAKLHKADLAAAQLESVSNRVSGTLELLSATSNARAEMTATSTSPLTQEIHHV